ncbi:MAG: laminin G domain-containing protein [Micromonosporaceae bacterium]
MINRLLLVVAVGAATVVAGGATSAHAASNPVAIWEMNEARGARVMHDRSGRGLDGRVGDDVRTGVGHGGATAYHFPWVPPNAPPPKPEHLVLVPDAAALDPGTRAYTVTFRMSTTHSAGNILQKGQAGAAGGYFKFQNPHGRVECAFKGAAGGATVRADRALDDGGWHIIRCQRTWDTVTLAVDGRVVDRRSRVTGSISNSRPLSIGGKSNCDQRKVTCDYFSGHIDWVRIEAG